MVGHTPDWLPPNKQEEKAWFDTFIKTKVKGNQTASVVPDPCYTALPWPKQYASGEPVPELYKNYPYGTYNASATKRIYALRPNLKFNEILSKLMGQRNFRKLKASPNYDKTKLLLAAEAARCIDLNLSSGNELTSAQFHEALKKVLPEYVKPDDASADPVYLRGHTMTHHDPRHSSSLAQGLFGVAASSGFKNADWSMVYGTKSAAYETGAGPGVNRNFPGDLPLSACYLPESSPLQ